MNAGNTVHRTDPNGPVKASDPYYAVAQASAAVSVGDYVWEDVNRDGLQDSSDVPLSGVTLTISRSDGETVAAANGSPYSATTQVTAEDVKQSETRVVTRSV